MIIPLSFIVPLLFTITYATDFEYKIDLNRCDATGYDMSCFVRKACKDPNYAGDDKDNMDRFIGSTTEPLSTEVENCDAIVQVKSINSYKLMLLVQIKGKLKPDIGIIFEVKETPKRGPNPPPPNEMKMSCSNDGVTGQTTLTGFTFESTGKNVFDSDRMLCSIIIKAEQGYAVLVGMRTSTVLRFTSLKDDNSEQEQTLNFLDSRSLWSAAIFTCDFDNAKYDPVEAYLLTQIDRTRSPMKCTDDNARLLVSYTSTDGKAIIVEADEVICKNSYFMWTSPVAGQMEEDQIFSIGCIKMKYCTTCTEPTAFSQDECPTCEALPDTPNDENGCKVRKCPDDMFTIDGQEEVKSTKGITCEKKSDGTGSEWLIHNTDGGNVVDGKVSCYKFKGCRPLTKLNCPEGVECKTGPVFNQEIFNYTCPDADAVLHQNKELVTPSCDKETHEWKGIDNTVDLYCAVGQTKTDASKGDGETKTGGSGLTIGLAVVGSLVAVAAIAGGAYYMLVIRKRQEAKKTTKKEEGTSKKSSKKVQSKSGAAGSSNEAKKEEKKSDPNKESEKPAAEAAKEAPKDGKEAPKEGAEAAKEPPKDAAATPAAAATPGAPPTPAAPATPATPAADSAPAPADATPV